MKQSLVLVEIKKIRKDIKKLNLFKNETMFYTLSMISNFFQTALY